MSNGRILGTLLAGALLIGGCATMDSSAPVKYSSGVMVDNAGMTLYTFDKDRQGAGKSVCNGPCAGLWPPLAAGADGKPAGDFTIITRDDGSKQWAYKGKPLYLWIKDRKPGDRTGDGFNKAWHVVPQGSGSMRSGY